MRACLDRALICTGLTFLLALTSCEERRPEPRVPADKSRLEAATDVFWALQNMGYIAAKQKPVTSKHGCKPFEYLAQKDEARFRISVFECPTEDKAAQIVEHPHTRHVDSLLRNRHEGGVLRRRALQIIIRKEQGDAAAADELIEALGGI